MSWSDAAREAALLARQAKSLRQVTNHADLVRKAKLAELRQMMHGESEEARRGFVQRSLGPWQEQSGAVRGVAKKLAQLAKHGEPLHFLHPGQATIYRGGKAFAPGTAVSYSTSPGIARGFGSSVETRTVGPHDAALDLERVYGRGNSEREVIALAGSPSHRAAASSAVSHTAQFHAGKR